MFIDTKDFRYYEFDDAEIKIIEKALRLIYREQIKEQKHDIECDIDNVIYENKLR